MSKSRMLAAILAFGVIGGGPGQAADAQDKKLDEAMKAVELKLKKQPGDQSLKVWLDHARDFKSGERTDHPGTPPL